jgi:hypothetical protein
LDTSANIVILFNDGTKDTIKIQPDIYGLFSINIEEEKTIEKIRISIPPNENGGNYQIILKYLALTRMYGNNEGTTNEQS